MTVEIKAQETQIADVVISQSEPAKVEEETKEVVCKNAEEKKVDEPQHKAVERSHSFKEESYFFSDLKEPERKALVELKSKLEEAILGNSLFSKEEKKTNEESLDEGEGGIKSEKQDELNSEGDGKEETAEEGAEEKKPNEQSEETAVVVKTIEDGKEKKCDVDVKEKKSDVEVEEKSFAEVDRDISLWGVPLLPSKGTEGTDVILLKFLRAREFKVNEAFEMLKKTLQWRKDFKINSVLDEDLGADLVSSGYMSGSDHEGHPVCYNVYGVFDNEQLYKKAFGTDEQRLRFLRWRLQFMEKGIQNLNLKPGGVCSLLQINDLKNSPGLSRKELRITLKQLLGLLQDNYPEFVARNVFINVPFWYYALHSLFSPFLAQRTKSKFVFARPSKVTKTLLKYIPATEIPVQYGGFKRENDSEFSIEDGGVLGLAVKAGSDQTIEIPAPEAGTTLIWDLTVLGWEVNYKEEFVPANEESYTIIVQKSKKMGSHEAPVRNTFRNDEPGKVVITIHNGSIEKKRILYRYKIKRSL
ncbi:patellin-4-like [Malania oleifera]|uniref:patellin-4-like n=1 Tax=Malania oleifera TaxID=397392 RepID=UPI0025ADD58F|nr:patellin-4-like [Malania oleifera]XP_057971726.1 patellin-4-like [Malania oleifera]